MKKLHSTHVSGAVLERRVDEGHDGRLESHLVPVHAVTAVQVDNQRLKTNTEPSNRRIALAMVQI